MDTDKAEGPVEYLCGGAAVSHEVFVGRALDPAGSVIVEACAGSGKTWLLVGRIVRLLLAGAAPSRILAITFTRRAAQQMRERLLQDLARLARADDSAACALLVERGLAPHEAAAALPAARGLYERVAGAEDGVGIDTFHGWFWRILRAAPLGSGVPHTAGLAESTRRLLQEAWNDFAGTLVEGGTALADYEELVALAGDASAERLLRNFVARRTEWWSFAVAAAADSGPGRDADPDAGAEAGDAGLARRAVERACEPMRQALRRAGFSDDRHPAALLREPGFCDRLRDLAAMWRRFCERKTLKRVQESLQRAGEFLQSPPAGQPPELDLALALQILFTDEGEPRAALEPAKLAAAGAEPDYGERLAELQDLLERVRAAQLEWDALVLNRAGLRCGLLLLGAYEARKRQANVLDFVDIEWYADRLLASEETAAFMQAQLDWRYRHLLIDEFQDTSTLQWRVLQGWLGAYAAGEDGEGGEGGDPAGPANVLHVPHAPDAPHAADAPTVFVVGDPKQSIYRFRRAEPLVFEAARAHLARTMGALDLRTQVTRRNPRELVAVFDAVFDGNNPLYRPHSSLAPVPGHVTLLPLPQAAGAGGGARAGATASRDLLDEARAPAAGDLHYHEGRQLAQALLHWVGTLRIPVEGGTRAACWNDAVVLARRRLHMGALERALREAGIPTRSDRRGGLLDSPEVEDLVALLDFLCTRDDLSLAHALRTPVFGCSDEDLLALASAAPDGAGWWERLHALEARGLSEALARARTLLAAWLPGVGVLPVHDLLDRIFDSSDLRAAFAARTPAVRWPQVEANLDAFLQLALTLDAGRFPTLTRFLDELQALRQHDEDSADEGLPPADDALRIMTIHGAKGLEAPIVAIADATAGEGPDDRYDVLLGWPPQERAPQHFSLIGRAHRSGASRGDWLQADAAQREQEDWNLMYVALTRARQVLLVSGSAPAAGSFYGRLQQVISPAAGPGPESGTTAPAGAGANRVRDFRPAPHPAGQRIAPTRTEATRLGQAWHALLERHAGGRIPADAAMQLGAEFGVAPAHARLAVEAAHRVLAAPELARYFGAGAAAFNELEIVDASGATLRIDRLVELEDAIWILDYKWGCTPEQRPGYEQQLARYARAIADCHPGRTVRTALVLSDATLLACS